MRLAYPIVLVVAIAAVAIAIWMRPAADGVELLDWMGALHTETQAAFNREPTAATIRETILPAYAKATDEVTAFEAMDNASQERKRQALEILNLMSEAWCLAADALERENIVVEGQAVVAFEQAREKLRDMGAIVMDPPASIRDEIALLLSADSEMNQQLAKLVADELPEPARADAVEADVLPDWERARDRFIQATTAPPQKYERTVSRLLEYAELRSEAIRQQIDGFREQDDVKTMRGSELFAQARELQQTIMQDGLTE